MLLASKSRTARLAAAAVIVTGSASAPAAPTKAYCIATNESAQDLRHSGKLRNAQALFALCKTATCPRPIREDCAQELDEIADAMPSIVFELKDAAGHEVLGVTVTMDGQQVDASASTAIEVDPGEHTFTFEANGMQKVEKQFVVAEGVKGRLEVIVFGPIETTSTAMISSGTSDHAAAASADPNKVAPTRSSEQAMVDQATFGIGGIGLAVGIGAGLVAASKHSTLAGECDNSRSTCPPKYTSDLNAFHTWRTISTVGYVVGAVGLASGITFLALTWNVHNTKTARVWLGPASAGVAGTF